MMKLKKLANEKGFTLIELMIVIAIIGILSAVAIPNYITFKNKSFCTATVNDTNAIAAAMADYFAIPGNVTASVTYTAGDAQTGSRPFINIGNTTTVGNTLLLSASSTTTAVTRKGSSYLISVTEGAGNCPTKVTGADNHWTGGGGTAAVYVMTL